jgi:hypothetical protein
MPRIRSLHVVTFVVLIVARSQPLRSQPSQCLAHFQESGSIFKGKVLETYEEFASIDAATALRRLQAQLPGAGVAIVGVDADKGIIKGENQAPNARPFPINLTIIPASSGVRIGLWLKLNAGQMVVGGTKPALCDIIQLANTEPAPPPPPPKAPEPALTNAAIVDLVQAGVDDEIILAKIKQSAQVNFDLSTEALVDLKKKKVSKTVVSAMLGRAGSEGGTAGAPSTVPAVTASASHQPPPPKPVSDKLRREKPLSRTTAELLISASKEAAAAQYEKFFLGADFRQTDFIGFGNWPFLDALVRVGYVQKQGNGWALTAKGNAASGNWQRDPERPNARLVPVAKREITAVTGITDAELGQGTIAEFTWVWRSTVVLEEVSRVDPRIAQKYAAEEHKGEALLKYYDDGWRIQEIHW